MSNFDHKPNLSLLSEANSGALWGQLPPPCSLSKPQVTPPHRSAEFGDPALWLETAESQKG